MASSPPGVPSPRYVDTIGSAIYDLRIDGTSRQDLHQNLDRVTRIASSMQLRQEFETTYLGVDAERRGWLAQMLAGPQGFEAGQYIQNLVLVETNKWLVDSPDAFGILCLIAERTRNLKLFHLGYNNRYLNWALLPRRMHLLLMRIMRQAKTVILEGAKNIPFALIYALQYVQCLDLAQIKFAPMSPQDAVAPDTIPRAAPRALTIHTRIAENWEDNESDGTLRAIRTLKDYPGIRFSELRILYLDYLGCNGCAKTWKEAITLCKNTLVTLKLNYYPEGDGELVDLSDMGVLRDLTLSVVAHPHAIMYLALLLNSLNVPTTHLSKLKLYIDDRHLTGEDNWTDVVSRDRTSLARYAAILDTQICNILRAYADTEVCFRLPTAGRASRPTAEAFMANALPCTVRSRGFRLEHVGDEYPITFSMSPHIRESIGM